MKKSKIKLLTATACLALVGTASAAWVYAGTATASANIGVKVASYASAGTITVTGNDKISVLLDNGTISYVRDSDTDKLYATYSKPVGFEDDNTKTVTKTFQVYISPALVKYVEFKDYDNAKGYVGGWRGYKAQTWEDGEDLFSKLPALVWEDDMCPTTEDGYKNLINTIKEGTITDSNWDDNQNTMWDATSLNSEYYIKIEFEAVVS